MGKYNEQELINGLKQGDRGIILFLMKKHEESIKRIVNDYKIERYIQPEDVIQDGMVELIINIREDKFRGNSSITTYYYSICRYICLKLYKKYKEIYYIPDELEIKDQDAYEFVKDERIDKVLEILKNMKKECIEIIDLRFGLSQNGQNVERTLDKRGFEEIAAILKIEYANARQRFSRCIQSLLALYQKRETRFKLIR